jgi:hypothetical protein
MVYKLYLLKAVFFPVLFSTANVRVGVKYNYLYFQIFTLKNGYLTQEYMYYICTLMCIYIYLFTSLFIYLYFQVINSQRML